MRVQIALGDLADPLSFRHALRGVRTVVHLAASIRDQPGGSIEELNGVATWRMVRAAERAGVEQFVFFSALEASTRSRARFFRAKALAERAVAESALRHDDLRPVDRLLARGSVAAACSSGCRCCPAMPIAGAGAPRFQPIWAEDVADCVVAALDGAGDGRARYELAGPGHAHLRRHRRAGAALRRPPPPARPRAAAAGARCLRAVEALVGPRGLRHLGRGGADGGADDDAAAGPPTPSASASCPKPMRAVLGVG